MISIKNECKNPYFNLALEEYSLKHLNPEENYIMLWQNEPSVIIGRNQNTIEEINLKYITRNDIPVVRRLSGGGTVYHDLGNLNFTFIVKNAKDAVSNFKKFTEPVINALKQLGLNAEFSNRSDLTINGRKFSGNAQYYYGSRLLHHGTILFNSDLTVVEEALKVNQNKIESRSVKSVRSKVTNIYPYLPVKIDIMEFKDILLKSITEDDNYKERQYILNEDELLRIRELMDSKYSRWEWNYGQSPAFLIEKSKGYAGGKLELRFYVSEGSIKDLKIYVDFFGNKYVSEIEELLEGMLYKEDVIRELLNSMDFENFYPGITIDDFIECMFY